MTSPTPYLTIAIDYFNSTKTNKLPQDFKPIGFMHDLHEYTSPSEYFLYLHEDLSVLSEPERIEHLTTYLLFLSAIHSEI